MECCLGVVQRSIPQVLFSQFAMKFNMTWSAGPADDKKKKMSDSGHVQLTDLYAIQIIKKENGKLQKNKKIFILYLCRTD